MYNLHAVSLFLVKQRRSVKHKWQLPMEWEGTIARIVPAANCSTLLRHVHSM